MELDQSLSPKNKLSTALSEQYVASLLASIERQTGYFWRRLNPFTKPVNLPSIADIIMRSTVLSHRNMIEETEKLTDFKFSLDVRPYSAVDYDAYEALAEIGNQTAQKDIAEWKKNERWISKGLQKFSSE